MEDVTEVIHSKAIVSCNKEMADLMPSIMPFIRRVPRVPSVINGNKKYSTFRILAKKGWSLLILVKDEYIGNAIEIEIELTYEYFTYNEILSKLLPTGIQSPASFEIIGSIVHLNLDEEQMIYKDVIGRVIHDKTGKTVITKIGKISNEHRCFDLEIIGGTGNLETIHREGDILFYMDYGKVYWCSRLQDERLKLLKNFMKGEVVCDLFCGIGPVSLAALNKGCRVYSNDLNPHAIECMKKSMKLNNMDLSDIKVFNLPAKEFLTDIENVHIDHFFLNLPEHSLDYLMTISSWDNEFMVHCYFFCGSNESVVDYLFRKIGLKAESDMLRIVRKVSPCKDMYKLEISGSALKRGFEQHKARSDD